MGSENPYTAQLGRISGKLLQPNLTRTANLSFRNGPVDADLLYVDVANQRIGVNTDAPTRDIDTLGYTKIHNDVIVNGTKATIDNIIIGTDNIFRTTVGPILVETSDPNTKFFHGQLLTDELDFNGQSIKSLNSNQSIALSASGTGAVELQAHVSVNGDVEVTGNIRARQNLQFNGQLIIGDQITDTVAVNLDFTQSLVPGTNNTYDLGTAARKWDRVQIYGVDNVNQFVAQGFTVSDQQGASGNTLRTLQSNEDLRLIASTGNTYLANFEIVEVNYYKVGINGLYLEDNGLGSSQPSLSRGFSFDHDGTTVFTLTAQGTLRAYPLSTAYDPSTIGDKDSYTQINLLGLGGITTVSDLGTLFFKPDGTRFFVGGRSGSAATFRKIFQYDLSVPWNITTASSSGSWSVLHDPRGIMDPWFNQDGTKLIVHPRTSNIFYVYDLPTAYNVVDTLDPVVLQIYTLTESTQIQQFAFSSDGLTIYVNSLLGEFKTISFPTAWNLAGGTTVDTGTTEYLSSTVSDMKLYNGDFYTSGLDGLSKITITINPIRITNQLNSPVVFTQTGTGYLRLADTNGFRIPSGNSSERENLEIGDTRWNTELAYLECFDGTVWQLSTGSGAVISQEAMEELGRLYSLILG